MELDKNHLTVKSPKFRKYYFELVSKLVHGRFSEQSLHLYPSSRDSTGKAWKTPSRGQWKLIKAWGHDPTKHRIPDMIRNMQHGGLGFRVCGLRFRVEWSLSSGCLYSGFYFLKGHGLHKLLQLERAVQNLRRRFP